MKYTVLPMITYGFQDDAARKIIRCMEHQSLIGRSDVAWEKSRTMGISWLMMFLIEHKWHFYNMLSFLVASRKEDLVDKRGDSDTLLGKIDFIRAHQPGWLIPRITRNKLHLKNEDNGSLISGESTNNDLGVGGRRTALVLDEFALLENGHDVAKGTRDVSKCRIFVSTHRGASTPFYKIIQNMREKNADGRDMPVGTVIRTHWSEHPIYSRGLELRDGKPWSPWYQHEADTAIHPNEIKQELDIDPLGSDSQFFEEEPLRSMEREYCCAPTSVGELGYNIAAQPTEFEEFDIGRLRLWMPVVDGKVATGNERYVVAADIATGTGASNSVLSIGRASDKYKVGELATPYVRPEELATYAVALCRWLGDAYLIWESNGSGRIFGDRVIELGYRELYWQRNERSMTKKVRDVPGWPSTRESKRSLMGEYRRAIKRREVVIQNQESMEECRQYVFTVAGAVEHSDSISNPDPSGARDSHGDRVVADALMWKGLKEHVRAVAEEEPVIAPGCYAWRKRERDRRRKELLEL